MILHTILQNHHGSWKYHRIFGKYDVFFLLVRNFISRHAKTWSVLVLKEIVQWPSGTLLPDFVHMLTLSVWIWDS